MAIAPHPVAAHLCQHYARARRFRVVRFDRFDCREFTPNGLLVVPHEIDTDTGQ